MAQYSFCPLCLSERKHYEAREQWLRELARKWIIDDSHSPTVVRDGEVCGNELEAILNEGVKP